MQNTTPAPYLYRNFTSPEALDAEYRLSATVPDFTLYPPLYMSKSKALVEEIGAAAASCRQYTELPYGPTLDETLDLFVPTQQQGCPLFIFIHGGYWRAFSSRDFWFVGRALLQQGCAVAHVNYSLCPKVGIGEIVRQCRAAAVWLAKNGADYGLDCARIHIGGHSAGGHLALCTAMADWEAEYGFAENPICSVLAISPLCDLRPLRFTYLQPYLQLDADSIARYSPQLQVRACASQIVLTVGENEPAEMQRQARDFDHVWRQAGNQSRFMLASGRNHFDILFDLEAPGGILAAQASDLLGGKL